ncbi:hypothetical protein FR932_05775 [Moritella marina ATCC 15381]|uniref:Porin family protein n=1 Tax=Moritella marina ATCC 15381 TaxID=1202962 RepID=A0A5J6WLK1_MORMI|nr:hypothetical protein [Moritella marina]QFI37372.1 hypothetical protein FR932_05775 [Moritella marina ATCC 15381]
MNKAILLAIFLAASSVTHAQSVTIEDTVEQQLTPAEVIQKVKGFYLGGAIGSTVFDSLDYDTPYAEEDGNTLKFIIGYQFNRVFALEGQ